MEIDMKKIKTDVKKVKLISVEMKMVVPTGSYANIQPCIVVKSETVEQAMDYIMPHLNKLWKEYYMVSERRPAEKVDISVPATPATVVEATPVSSVALIKATQAINSCLSLDALEMIKNQVEKSVKLTNEDKTSLYPLIANKFSELTNNGQDNSSQAVS